MVKAIWSAIAFILIATATIPSHAQTLGPSKPTELQAKGMKALPVRAVGRVSAKPLPAPMPKGSVGYSHQWPAVYFEAAFTGDSVMLKFDDALNEYRLFIDDGKPITIAQPGAAMFKVSGLPRKAHKLRLEKVTESIAGVGAFQGFYIGKGSKAGIASPRKRQIEFIGDSGMAGYGIRSPKRECTQEEVRLLSDTQISFPALAAKHFNADYQVNAYSGRGVIRNYGGAEPGLTMPVLYPYSLYDRSAPYADAKWQPQIIVVGLGANDVSTPLKPDEKWQTTDQFARDFVESYTAFLSQVHKRNPRAALVIIWPGSEEFSNAEIAKYAVLGKTMLEEQTKQIGFRSVDFLALDDMKAETTACDYHWSMMAHQQLTGWMTRFLESKPELWGD
jgi:lysophospholipase L1-like esterase